MPVVVTYDIACQYSKNFWKHAQGLPLDIYPKFSSDQLEFFVGILHVINHVSACQGKWSGRYRKGNANTPGDNIEHGWPSLNIIAYSARRMTEGGRIDLLNSALGSWNFDKLTRIGNAHSLLCSF
jgi:hypothetical protein